MHEAVQGFVERMGLMMESEGLPRIAGRIFGFLLVHEGAYSLDELAERLAVLAAQIGDTRFSVRFPGRIQPRVLASGG